MARLITFVTAAVATVACVSHAPLAEDYDGPQALPDSVARTFDYPSDAIRTEDVRVRQRAGFTIREVMFPSINDAQRPVRLEYYDIASDEPVPVVLVLPIFNGQLRVSRYFARHFANQGWAAVMVDRDRPELEEELLEPEQAIRSHLIDLLRVLDWIDQNPQFDTRRVGVFGISRGGMDAVMLAALDERVNAVVAAMAGGDLAYLLMNTSYRSINRSVAQVLDESGLTREALEQELSERIRTEPVALAPYVDAEDVLLILTRGDWIVPFDAQQELLESLGQPEALFLPTGHRTSVVYFPLLRSSAYEFFERRFKVPDSPLARQ